MEIRGLIKFSLNDYPGQMSCVVFTGHCNFRCPYCHNPHLVFDPESQPLIPEEEFFDFLDRRVGKLDAVVISGGEPTLQNDYDLFARKVKEKGFLVKLDTNGSMPDKVIECLKNGDIDYLGIDYKATNAKYNQIAYCDDPNLVEKVQGLIKYAVHNNVAFDIRTTVHKSLLSVDDLKEMRKELNELGVKQWTIQQFNPVDIIDDDLIEQDTYSDTELLEISRQLGSDTKVRGLKGLYLE